MGRLVINISCQGLCLAFSTASTSLIFIPQYGIKCVEIRNYSSNITYLDPIESIECGHFMLTTLSLKNLALYK